MTYSDIELSVHDAQPVEAYRFIGPYAEYRYTSAEKEIVVNGQTYTPVPLTRTAIGAGTHDDELTVLEIEVPNSLPLVRDYAFRIAPRSLELTVYRSHRTLNTSSTFIVYWKGRVSGFRVSGGVTKIQVPSVLGVLLTNEVPNVYFQGSCNHVLYDTRCKVNISAYSETSTITTITDTSVLVGSVNGRPNGFFVGGEMFNETIGERRLIIEQTGNQLGIAYPFSSLASAGNTVTMRAGCDHSFTACKTKFANGINFGGFPYMPKNNPFQGSL